MLKYIYNLTDRDQSEMRNSEKTMKAKFLKGAA